MGVGHGFGDALWWASVSVNTVGYGDKYPISAGERGVATVLMFVGIGLIGVLTATVASYFVEQGADEERAELIDRLDRIEVMLNELTGGMPGSPLREPDAKGITSPSDSWVIPEP